MNITVGKIKAIDGQKELIWDQPLEINMDFSQICYVKIILGFLDRSIDVKCKKNYILKCKNFFA